MRRSTVGRLAVLALTLSLTGACGGDDTAAPASSDADSSASCAPEIGNAEDLDKKPDITVTAGGGVDTPEQKDLVTGTGAEATLGKQITVQYVGVSCTSGEQFDASWDRGAEPVTFPLEVGGLIKGWTDAIPGMKVGGRRLLVIPSEDGYGASGSPPDIAPNDPLVFVVDLVAVA